VIRAWLVAVLAVIGCGRIGFDELASIGGSLTAGPNIGGREGTVTGTITVDQRELVDHVEVRRVSGPNAPAGCRDGDVVVEMDAPSSTGTGPASLAFTDRVQDPWIRLHGYRLCIYGLDGGISTGPTMEVAAVRYYNPAPGCAQPPCDLIDSTVASTQFVLAGTLTQLAAPAAGGGDLILSDLDDDGHLDAIAAAIGIDTIHRGAGDGTFSAAIPLNTASTDTQAAVVGDFDHDNHKDIVMVNRDAPCSIFRGKGGATFAAEEPIDAAIYPDVFDVEAADLDGDTFLDLVITQFGAEDRIYLNDGTGTFRFAGVVHPIANESCVNCLRIRDVNGDDLPDLVTAYNGGTDRVEIVPGNGDGTFAAPLEIDYGTLTPIAVDLADFNRDGLLDLVVGQSQSGGVFVSLAASRTSYTPLVQLGLTTSSRTYGLVAADLDGDGNPDILAAPEDPGSILFVPGNGDGTFGPEVELGGGAAWTAANLAIGDLDEDGRLDFVLGARDTPSQVFLAR